ncbi:hypothetical protein V3481_012036 [Fusarium oxysporum f. sp. vasinfectum]|uniref:DUF7580 domain-containing protein n=1 Tax=Fusarium oxysporum f. sp. vasinfectum 25433 TaxID=1089449 RepID=X0MJ36_FUSOX|nr:hypothetical protein FOTG_11471 [Fusarium oxysporum f. sp. vasinfectum 25433]
MNDLIVSLYAEHSRFRHSCSVLLRGLVEDKDLEDFLDKTNKEEWEKALAQGLEKSLREKLGHRYYAYTEIIKQIQEKLETLGKVVGMGKHQQWYEKTEYENQKTWHKIKKCIKHSKHKQLLEDLEKYNTKLEQMTPGILTQAQTALSQPKKTDLSYWDSIRQAAVSLHSALCSGWLCCCAKPHLTHFQLEDRVTGKKGPHKFKLSFKMPQIGDAGQSVRNTDWQSAEFEAFEDDDLPKDLPRSPGSVAFAVGGTTASTSLKVERHIKDLCKELKQPSCQSEVRCIGFILQEEHKHYIHLPKRLLTSEGSRDTITLHSFLSNKGQLGTHYTFGNEVTDRYELALLLASSLLQLHATSWLGDWWSTDDIHILPKSSKMAFKDCTFVMQTFPSSVISRGSQPYKTTRQMVIRNEAIFRLGATLVELSTVATLEAQEELDDHRITEELTDFNTAERLSKAVALNNALEWNAVVDRCLRCGFHSPPDFTRKDFRAEFYQCVVVPLEKLYDDSKIN